MHKRTFLVAAFAALLIPSLALGAMFKAGDNVGISAEVQGDLYIAGGSVASSKAVRGDVYAAGGTVLVSGPISEDFGAAGGTVTVSSDVGDDVRIGGGTVILQGAVGGDVLVGGGQVAIAGSVSGDIVVGAGTVRIEAPVGGDVRVGGGNVYINSEIAGTVHANAEELELGPNAVINGALSYRSPHEAVIDDAAQVNGAISYEPRAGDEEVVAFGAVLAAALFSAWLVAKTLMLTASALIIGLVFKRFSKDAVTAVVRTPWRALGRGLVVFIVLPVVSAMLLASVVGIPFGILGLAALVALATVSCALAAILLGALVYKWTTKGKEVVVSWKTILLGVILYMALGFVPVVGWIVVLLAILAAGGAVSGLVGKAVQAMR